MRNMMSSKKNEKIKCGGKEKEKRGVKIIC